ncbi:unnamed protein product [Boreogadus saida]
MREVTEPQMVSSGSEDSDSVQDHQRHQVSPVQKCVESTLGQASKKWENLKKRYKDLKSPKTGSGTNEGEVTAASWQFYDDMHEVLGSRPSIDPVVIVASFSEDPTTLDIVESTATSPPTSPSCSSTTGTSSTTPDTSFTTAAYPPSPETRVKRRQESAREQRRHEESEAKFAERHKCHGLSVSLSCFGVFPCVSLLC